MRRLTTVLSALGLATVLLTPSTTYAQQSLNLSLGGFVPAGEDTRGDIDGGDVLVNNLDFLAFNVKDFNGATVGAEYIVGLTPFVDASLGIGAYRRTVPSVYADLVNANQSEIEQDLKLRIIPFTATVRFLPAGRDAALVPYIGAGVGVFNWRYVESGDWVDSNDDIYRDSFSGSGTATGPVILGGLRIPAGAWDIGGEVRWQKAKGDLPGSESFSADSINLGGWTYAATFNIHF
jgi:hypothetical protein